MCKMKLTISDPSEFHIRPITLTQQGTYNMGRDATSQDRKARIQIRKYSKSLENIPRNLAEDGLESIGYLGSRHTTVSRKHIQFELTSTTATLNILSKRNKTLLNSEDISTMKTTNLKKGANILKLGGNLSLMLYWEPDQQQ